MNNINKELYLSTEALKELQDWAKSKGTYITQYITNWDFYFLDLCKVISQKSKDPSTKCGSLIVNERNEIVSSGFNGFPVGVLDSKERLENRDLKYKLVCHSEINAILFANQRPINCTLYNYPMPSCLSCSKYIIQSGIKRIVSPILPLNKQERWKEDMDLANKILKEAKVDVILIDYK